MDLLVKKGSQNEERSPKGNPFLYNNKAAGQKKIEILSKNLRVQGKRKLLESPRKTCFEGDSAVFRQHFN